MNSIQDRVYKATEYGIEAIKTLKFSKEIYKNQTYKGDEIIEILINIHETYLKMLKGDKNEK